MTEGLRLAWCMFTCHPRPRSLSDSCTISLLKCGTLILRTPLLLSSYCKTSACFIRHLQNNSTPVLICSVPVLKSRLFFCASKRSIYSAIRHPRVDHLGRIIYIIEVGDKKYGNIRKSIMDGLKS